MSHPSTPAPGPASTAGERDERFGSRCRVTLERPLGVWSAMRRSPDGRHIRVIIGPSAAELETAEQAGP